LVIWWNEFPETEADFIIMRRTVNEEFAASAYGKSAP
jgi:hypothetical protein